MWTKILGCYLAKVCRKFLISSRTLSMLLVGFQQESFNISMFVTRCISAPWNAHHIIAFARHTRPSRRACTNHEFTSTNSFLAFVRHGKRRSPLLWSHQNSRKSTLWLLEEATKTRMFKIRKAVLCHVTTLNMWHEHRYSLGFSIYMTMLPAILVLQGNYRKCI